MTSKKVSSVMFVVLVSALFLTVAQNVIAQEAEHENDTTTVNIDFLQFYDNELFHWNPTKSGKLTFWSLKDQLISDFKKLGYSQVAIDLHMDFFLHPYKYKDPLYEFNKKRDLPGFDKAPVIPEFRVPELKMPKFEPPNFSELKIPSNRR
jgi:hypothetical protein